MEQQGERQDDENIGRRIVEGVDPGGAGAQAHLKVLEGGHVVERGGRAALPDEARGRIKDKEIAAVVRVNPGHSK